MHSLSHVDFCLILTSKQLYYLISCWFRVFDVIPNVPVGALVMHYIFNIAAAFLLPWAAGSWFRLFHVIQNKPVPRVANLIILFAIVRYLFQAAAVLLNIERIYSVITVKLLH